jgi:pyruvate/2-oxoglutarate dehydrogenase complex dihydrolipoamide acyltransferase (E2) component
MPGLKAGTEEQIIKGMYLLEEGREEDAARQPARLGTILRESIAAKELLEKDWGVAANIWSCPSFNELARDGQDASAGTCCNRPSRPRVPFVTQQLEPYAGPVIASTDYMKNYAEQIRAFIPKGRVYKVLGTDGFGRSDFRSKLREHFEVNRHYIVVAAAEGAADEARCRRQGREAIQEYGINAARSTRCTPDSKRTRRQQHGIGEVKSPTSGTSRTSRSSSCWSSRRHGEGRQSLLTVESDKARWRFRHRTAVVKESRSRSATRSSEGSLVLMLEAEGPLPRPHRHRPGSSPAARAAPSAPAPAARRGAGPVDVVVPDIGDFDEVAVIEVWSSRRHDQGRAEPDHRRERQGLDGDSVVARRRREGAEGQGRRQGAKGTPVASSRRPAAPRPRRPAARPPAAPAPPPRARRRARPQPSSAVADRRLPAHEPTAAKGSLPHASPTIRKLARELGVPLERSRARAQGPHHARRRARFRQGRDGGAVQTKAQGRQGTGRRSRRRRLPRACCRGRRSTSRSSAGRAQGPVAHQEDQRRQPAPQLGRDPACHQP